MGSERIRIDKFRGGKGLGNEQLKGLGNKFKWNSQITWECDDEEDEDEDEGAGVEQGHGEQANVADHGNKQEEGGNTLVTLESS